MRIEPNHDPVNALSEADATGRTAEIFSEIRDVMQIPIVTSIWRTLTAIEGGLEAVWAATRPHYESGQPDIVLEKMTSQVSFPVAGPVSSERLKAAGFDGDDRSKILGILEAYNRSNGLNLIALTMVVSNSHRHHVDDSPPAPLPPWPELPALLEKEDINAANWKLLEKIKHIGASNRDPAMPTLWRHLAHWPDLLTLILDSYLPLHQSGSINPIIEQVRLFAETEAQRTSHGQTRNQDIPPEAWEMISSYVGKPPSVTRMVTVGHGVVQWLKGCDAPEASVAR